MSNRNEADGDGPGVKFCCGKCGQRQRGRMGSNWMTANEAAVYLQVKVRTLLLWVRQGKVQAYALSGAKRRVWRFLRADLDGALLAHPVIVAPAPTVLSKERRAM